MYIPIMSDQIPVYKKMYIYGSFYQVIPLDVPYVNIPFIIIYYDS